MAKRTVSDIARERGVTEAEVNERLTAAGATGGAADELVDDDDVRRAFGAKAAVPAQSGQAGGHVRPRRGAQSSKRRRVVIDSQAGRKQPGQRRDGRAQQRPEAKKEPEAPT